MTSMARPSAPTSSQAEAAERPGKKVVGEKRKPIRRDPEKRRQQNLQAQKKYRDRLRKRLDDLEILAASVVKSRETAAEVTQTATSTSPVTTLSDETTTPESTPDDWALPALPMLQQIHVPSATPYDVFISPPTPSTGDIATDMSQWDSATFIDPSYLTMTNCALPQASKDELYTASIDCGCPVRHVQIRTKKPDSLEDMHLFKISESTPSPRANHLRIQLICNISAMFTICQSMGLSPDTICDEGSQSPFYRPGATITLDFTTTTPSANGRQAVISDSVVHTVKSIYKTLKPDLRPTKEQIVIPHDSFVDILPFPTLRKNILNGSVALDEDALFHDLLNGLVCWGGAGLSSRDRNTATGKASAAGTPWDARSWEAKPWFIRKYWLLLGCDEGELVRQSEWWRNVRGEEADIWAAVYDEPQSDMDFSDICPPALIVGPPRP